MKIEETSPHGMCAGVRTAVDLTMRHRGAYCLHSLVHNEMVVGDLKALGYRFVEDVEDIPDGAVVVFSAHGVSPAVRARAEEKGLEIVDATCTFVARSHRAVRDFCARSLPVVVIGDPEHVEVKGLLGEIPEPREPVKGERIGVVSQTTLDAVLVLGSRNSSNTRRLCEVAKCRSFIAGCMDDVKALLDELEKFERVGVTSGASTPEWFFQSVVDLRRVQN